jgi:hypothetical protein
MRFVSVNPVKDKTICFVKNEMVASEFQWTDDSTKVNEINNQLIANGFGVLTAEEIIEIEKQLEIIRIDRESVE